MCVSVPGAYAHATARVEVRGLICESPFSSSSGLKHGDKYVYLLSRLSGPKLISCSCFTSLHATEKIFTDLHSGMLALEALSDWGISSHYGSEQMMDSKAC